MSPTPSVVIQPAGLATNHLELKSKVGITALGLPLTAAVHPGAKLGGAIELTLKISNDTNDVCRYLRWDYETIEHNFDIEVWHDGKPLYPSDLGNWVLPKDAPTTSGGPDAALAQGDSIVNTIDL